MQSLGWDPRVLCIIEWLDQPYQRYYPQCPPPKSSSRKEAESLNFEINNMVVKGHIDNTQLLGRGGVPLIVVQCLTKIDLITAFRRF